MRDTGAEDSGAPLDTSEASCSLSPSQIVGQPSSDVGRQGESGNLGYQYVMRHCIKVSCKVYGHTHCTVRWFPLVEACLDVCCELEEGRCSRVSRSLAGEINLLIEGKMSASRTLAAGHSSEMGM